MGFQFEQYRLGLWDLSWDLKKTISWEMGLGPPRPSQPSQNTNHRNFRGFKIYNFNTHFGVFWSNFFKIAFLFQFFKFH